MVNSNLLGLGLALAITLPVRISAAEPPAAVVESSKVKPVLSESGKKRLGENLHILDENIRDLKENVTTTKKNIVTIQEELKELDGLETEHLALQKKYAEYLSVSRSELVRNDQATSALDAAEKALGATPDAGKLAGLRGERQERLNWKNDAVKKIEHTEKLVNDLAKNLRDITSRKIPLNDALSTWRQREKEYGRLLRDMESKKAELERIANK